VLDHSNAAHQTLSLMGLIPRDYQLSFAQRIQCIDNVALGSRDTPLDIHGARFVGLEFMELQIVVRGLHPKDLFAHLPNAAQHELIVFKSRGCVSRKEPDPVENSCVEVYMFEQEADCKMDNN
jgi:hypothetical protein